MVWTALSRRLGKIVAFVISSVCGVETAQLLYDKAESAVGEILFVFTDANSCYDKAFALRGLAHKHAMTKTQTHQIESTNSSIRDNLARFNRKSKRYTKSIDMLARTLMLFCQYKKFNTR
jgi:IS1 family transposase